VQERLEVRERVETTYTPVRLRKQITKFCTNWRSR